MILVTGFERYGGRSKNPSQAVAERLDGQVLGGHTVKAAILPVDYTQLVSRARQLLDELQPVVAISLGLWPGESTVRLERVGINCADFEIADNAGRMVSECVVPGGVDAHLTTLPIHEIRNKLLEAGIPARLSGSAGTFLCNTLMYAMLSHCAQTGAATRCGFIHVPYLPAQVAEMMAALIEDATLEFHQRADFASMDLEHMVQAVRVAIEVSLETA